MSDVQERIVSSGQSLPGAPANRVSLLVPILSPGSKVMHKGRPRVVSHVVISDLRLFVALAGEEKPVHVDDITPSWRTVHYDPPMREDRAIVGRRTPPKKGAEVADTPP